VVTGREISQGHDVGAPIGLRIVKCATASGDYPCLLLWGNHRVVMMETNGTNTSGVGYVPHESPDCEEGTLYVAFRNDRMYRYYDVPHEIALRLLRSTHVAGGTGALLNSLVIRPKDYAPFKCEKVM